MRYLLISFAFLMSFFSFSKEFLPKDCHAVPIDETIALSQQKNHILLMHSLSNYEIWLANPKQSRLTVSLVPGEWSAFYAPKDKAQWFCIQSQPGHEQKVPCQQVLALCDWSATAPKKEISKINSWVANNLSYSELHAYLQRIGWQFNKK